MTYARYVVKLLKGFSWEISGDLAL